MKKKKCNTARIKLFRSRKSPGQEKEERGGECAKNKKQTKCKKDYYPVPPGPSLGIRCQRTGLTFLTRYME